MLNSFIKRWLAILIFVLLAANITTLVLLWAHTKKDTVEKGGLPKGQVFEFVTKELQLDKQQQETYAALRDEHQQGMKMIQDCMRIVKDSFFSLLKDPAATDAVIMQNSRKAGDIEQQVELFTFRHFQKLRAICKPDQQQKFDKIIQDVLQRMGKPKGRPGPPQGREGDKLPPPPEGREEDNRRPPQG